MEANSENITNNQKFLIDFFSRKRSEEELKDIRKLISIYYAQKASLAADKVWDEKGWTNETMEEFLKTHMRTPYDSKDKNTNVDVNSVVSDFFERYKSSK